jgi:hypothetical protein
MNHLKSVEHFISLTKLKIELKMTLSFIKEFENAGLLLLLEDLMLPAISFLKED